MKKNGFHVWILLCATSVLPRLTPAELIEPLRDDEMGFATSENISLQANSHKVEACLQTINQATQQKKWDEALEIVLKGLQDFPDQPDLLIQAGHLYTVKGQYTVAERYWAKLVEKFPDNPWARACWAGLLLRTDRVDEAEKELNNSLAKNKTLLVARYHLACIQIKKEDLNLAKQTLKALSSYEIGNLVTWLRDEYKPLITLLEENGYRQLAGIVITDDDRMEIPATRSTDEVRTSMDRLANLLWESYSAEKQQIWTNALHALEEVQKLGITAPSIQNDIDQCRARLK